MVLRRSLDRLKYGSLVEDGHLNQYLDDYREKISDMDDVDVEIAEWLEPTSYQGSVLTPTTRKTSEVSAENLSGEEAWRFVDNSLREITPDGSGLNEIPFYFEHRSRGDNQTIRMGISGHSDLSSRRDYRLKLEI